MEHVGAHPCPHANTYTELVSQSPNSPLGFPVLVWGITSQPEAGADTSDPLFYTSTSGQSLKSWSSYLLDLSSPSTSLSRCCSLPTILVTSSSSSSPSSFLLPSCSRKANHVTPWLKTLPLPCFPIALRYRLRFPGPCPPGRCRPLQVYAPCSTFYFCSPLGALFSHLGPRHPLVLCLITSLTLPVRVSLFSSSLLKSHFLHACILL